MSTSIMAWPEEALKPMFLFYLEHLKVLSGVHTCIGPKTRWFFPEQRGCESHCHLGNSGNSWATTLGPQRSRIPEIEWSLWDWNLLLGLNFSGDTEDRKTMPSFSITRRKIGNVYPSLNAIIFVFETCHFCGDCGNSKMLQHSLGQLDCPGKLWSHHPYRYVKDM